MDRWQQYKRKYRHWVQLLLSFVVTTCFAASLWSAASDHRFQIGRRGTVRWIVTWENEPGFFFLAFTFNLVLVLLGLIAVYFAIGQILHGIEVARADAD